MAVTETAIPGLFLVTASSSTDNRGSFTKSFEQSTFAKHGLATDFAEEYHTTSRQSVLRGMHFQTPPHAHHKTVFCLHGEVFDVVLDLRIGSPTFGVATHFHLSVSEPVGLYIPKGCAHGFASLTDESTLYYRVTTAYSRENDEGILWSSLDLDWPFENPLVSDRDSRFPALTDFRSPFRF